MKKALPILRASATRRWLNCTWFSHREWPEGPSSPEAAAGTRVHNEIAAQHGVTLKPDDERARTQEEHELAAQAAAYMRTVKEQRPGWTWTHEAHMVWESITGEDSIGGTADVLGVSPDGSEAMILDWKTGRAHQGYNDQLMTYAWLATHYDTRIKSVSIRLVYLADESESACVIDQDELREHSSEMMTAVSMRSEQPPVAVRGDWCQWCPASLECPTNNSLYKAASASILDTTVDLTSLCLKIESKQQAAVAHAFINYASDIVERMEAALKLYVRENGPAQTATGQTYGPFKQQRRTLSIADSERAVAVLLASPAAAAVKSTALWGDVKKLIKDKNALSRLEHDLIEAGGLRITEHEVWTTK